MMAIMRTPRALGVSVAICAILAAVAGGSQAASTTHESGGNLTAKHLAHSTTVKVGSLSRASSTYLLKRGITTLNQLGVIDGYAISTARDASDEWCFVAGSTSNATPITDCGGIEPTPSRPIFYQPVWIRSADGTVTGPVAVLGFASTSVASISVVYSDGSSQALKSQNGAFASLKLRSDADHLSVALASGATISYPMTAAGINSRG